MGRVFKPGPCSACDEPLVKGRCNRGMCARCAARVYLAEHPPSRLCNKCGKAHDRRLRCDPTVEVACSECGILGIPFAKGVCRSCYHRAYHAANREALNAKNLAAQARNPEAARKRSLDFHAKHPGYSSEKSRVNYPKYVATPEGRAKVRASVHRHRARLRALPATLTEAEWESTLAHFDGCCVYCGSRDRITRDHFIPAIHGGPYAASNMLPACKSCNSSKRHLLPQEFCTPELYEHLSAYLSALD